ncbi:MAG: NAD-dependent epimerase/dehydratase family protein [Bacteroidota bacterium]|nr:NAD-dependent epimerase/dehydratase family protein [Bacteroidota bacterium]
MDRVLVIGGAGYIGSNLCFELKKSYDVFSIDNYSSGSEDNHHDGVNYIKGHSSEIDKLIDFKPKYIFHLGEFSRVEKSFDYPDLVFSSNITGTLSVIKFALKHDSKLIYAGSSTKFGDNGNNINQSPYAWTKATNTELIKNFNSWYGLNYAIVYFYNVYGKNEIFSGEYATVMGIFKNKILKNQILEVVKPGTQKRNFTYIDDIVSGLILVGENGEGDGFGIGNPESYSILDIANFFNAKIKMIPERRGNRMNSKCDTIKTKKLGWKPKISVKDYILNKLFLDNNF